MNRSFLLTGVPVVAFALILLAVRPMFAEEYMAHADFSSCPRKYVPSTSADEGPFATKPQCMARVEAASRGNSMSCARYSCEEIRGGASTGSSGGIAGGSLQQQSIANIVGGMMGNNLQQMNLGLLGLGADMLLQGLLKGDQGQNAAGQAERAARAAEEAEAIAKGQEKERERIEQLRVRHQQLLGSLKGGLGNTELGLKRYETGTLELKTGTAMFGIQPNPTGTLKYGEETSGLALKMPDAPPTPTAKPIEGSQIEKVWADYLHAADEFAKADLRRQQLEAEKKLAERILKEAEKYHEQRQQAALIPKDQPAKQEEDDKLAEAEKLLNQATDLDQKATQDLDNAKQDLKQAKLDLDRTEKERAKAEKNLAQTEQGQPK